MTETLAQPSANEIVLIDLSSIAHPIWHMSQSEPDPNHSSQQIAARVRALANGHAHVAVCCDSGRSFRKDIADTYKANRPPAEAMLQHQITLACEQLQADGFPVWSVKGFEADDLIASATAMAVMSNEERSVLIVSADKDLLQLVSPRVRAMSSRDGAIFDEAGVQAKLGVRPDQVRDYLCLVGDASDNIKGAAGIGPKRAADLLTTFGSIDGIYTALREQPTKFTPAIATALKAFAAVSLEGTKSALETARELVSLRFDVELPFKDIFDLRVPKDVATFGQMDDEEELEAPPSAEPIAPTSIAAGSTGLPPSVPNGGDSGQLQLVKTDGNGHEPSLVAEWEMELEPRSMRDAKVLATDMYSSRLFSAYGTPAAILSTVMAGRELGMQAMASLRAFHIVEGKPTLAADLIRALVIKSGQAKYFRCTERTADRATFETQRGDDPPISLTYTVEEAKQAGLVKPNSAWVKSPADLCVARASSKLARLVYADVVHGLYSPEEID